ncbi:hypothetical protein ACFL6C_08955 [Myxococcota bacterium]
MRRVEDPSEFGIIAATFGPLPGVRQRQQDAELQALMPDIGDFNSEEDFGHAPNEPGDKTVAP